MSGTPTTDPGPDGQMPDGPSRAESMPDDPNPDGLIPDDRVPYARVTTDPLDRAAVEAAVLRDVDGAVVVFEGVIRNHDGGKGVRGLEYQAHPDAEATLREICADVSRTTGLVTAAAHRYGELTIGDVALVAAVAAAHRAEAFAACHLLVDEIKKRTPIWKRQHLSDGTSEWVGL